MQKKQGVKKLALIMVVFVLMYMRWVVVVFSAMSCSVLTASSSSEPETDPKE